MPRRVGRAARIIRNYRNAFRIVSLTITSLGIAAACASEAVPSVQLVDAVGGATFDQPVEVGAYPDGRIFVAERDGQVWLVTDEGARSPLGDFGPIVEADRGEGLLSLALDPGFTETGWVWAYYFAAEEPWRSVLSRFEVLDGRIALESEFVVLEIEQPGFNQNGGAVRFDGEGYLYLSVGDGSASMDPFDQGQDTSTLLATVLRLDVSAASDAEPYRIPPTNPFVDDITARPEIFAYGFRNPWRMSIDRASGAIWLGDVGVSNAEEIDRVEAGGNYGWSVFEGTHCLSRECDGEGLTAPVHEYSHGESRCAVVGGVVYRGEAIDHLDAAYLFGDLCSGEIWALTGSAEPTLLADLDGMLVTFGVDEDGEVLVADYQGGGVYRLVQGRSRD